LRDKKNKAIIKILRFSKQEKILEKHKKKIIRTSLNSLDKLNELEAREQKKRKKKTRQESQLPVPASKVSAPADTPQVYSLADLSNFDNPDFIASLANYNPLDPFWSDQGISFSIPQTSQDS
jgi:hypothetical protein